MTPEELTEKFSGIGVWQRGGQRAPHKPLLLLLMMGKLEQGEERLIPFKAYQDKLEELLKEFGPYRKSYHPEFPFWYLKNDGFWELSNIDFFDRGKAKQPTRKQFVQHEVSGGFSQEAYNLLKSDERLLCNLARDLLIDHFPESMHESILDSVGLELTNSQTIRKRKRDSAFREKVLVAYGYKCAVCGFDINLGSHRKGIEAAHIKWHAAGGPDVESNGMALCTMHHKFFDLGGFTIRPNLTLRLSELLNGGDVYDQFFRVFDKKPVYKVKEEMLPQEDYLMWHAKEVFKGTVEEA